MEHRIRFRRTTLLSVGLACFLLGLILAKWRGIWISGDWLLVGLPFIFILRKKNLTALCGVILIGLIFGLWRAGIVLNQLSQYQDFFGQQVSISGQVQNDPIYDERGQLDFRIIGVTVKGEELPGQVRVRGFVNDIRRGDSVNAAGKLQSGFGSYQAELPFAQINVIKRSSSFVEKIRSEFFAATYSVLPEPEASLGLGFLVGLRSALPEDFDQQLQIAGLTHIVVASGYNLTILVRLSRRALAKRSKYQAFAASLALIFGFIAVTGASASITRAAVVTILSLVAWYYGRRLNPVLIILLGAALTAGVYPVYVWYDLGWWLSFLAFTGVLLVAPLVTHWFFGRKQPPLLGQIAVETLAAQALALPLIMYVFGDFSLVSLAANLAVVPLIPFAMMATFAAGSAGVLSTTIGAWWAIPANLILGYIVDITGFLASPSWAMQEIMLNKSGLVLIYATVFLLCLGIYRRTNFKFAKAPSIVE